MQDLWETLSATDVPPLPDEFDREVHHRLNDRLLWGQVAELVFGVLPYALAHMARRVRMVAVHLVGAFPDKFKK